MDVENQNGYNMTVEADNIGKHGIAAELSNHDDDGRLRRQGTVWTASSHIITAVIGSGVLSLAWAVAQLGWLFGPLLMLAFSVVTYYTSCLLSECYRSPDGKRNYTYVDAVKKNLSARQFMICGIAQYTVLIGTAIGYTIASAISMAAIQRSSCVKDHDYSCHVSNNPYMIAFGIAQVLLSQIPDFDRIWWLSVVAAVMSFGYSSIGLALGIAKVADAGHVKGTLWGNMGSPTVDDMWTVFQAIGDISFAYAFSQILLEIQDTLRSPPAEKKTMNKATLIGVSTTTLFYMLCGCAGYAAFGNTASGNMLADFYNPFWMVDIANLAIIIHLLGAYQVYCQPFYAFVESWAASKWPTSSFISNNRSVRVMSLCFEVNLFRLVWRSLSVVFTTVTAMVFPFFNDVVGLIGALTFWPLTVYYPVAMYIVQKRIQPWSSKWVWLQAMSLVCLLVTVAATCGSVVGVVDSLKVYKPFQTIS